MNIKPKTILQVIDLCDGWSILCPDRLREQGLPSNLIDELADCFESDPSDGRASIYSDGQLLNQAYGVYSLDLLKRFAALVNADLSGVVAMGRGTRAKQYKRAIRAALATKGGKQ